MKPGDLIGGRFEIEAFAGEGGMGAVHRALDRQTGELVALKHVPASSEGESRFHREARALALLDHPAIVRYVAHGTAQTGEPYLAMEWLEGETLRERLNAGPLGIDETVDLARRVAGALAQAHARGFVHRDLNPANLFLVGRRVDSVKVLDFGLARHRDERGETTAPMRGPMGTLGYMAPEQARGTADVDERADLFSLGSVLFECLTGRAAFGADNYLAVLAKIVVASAPRARELVAEVPEELDDIVASLLAKEPADRPDSADAVVDALWSLGGSRPSLSAPSSRGLALTAKERAFSSVIVVRQPTSAEPSLAAREVAERHTMLFERLADDSLVLVSTASGAATDRAARAARCALDLRNELGRARIALATGWALLDDGTPSGEVVVRAAELVQEDELEGVRIDDVTAELLATRFELRIDAQRPMLVAERQDSEVARVLLGRPSPCVGRDRELRTLVALLDEAFEAPLGRAVLLTGPAGVGKSRIQSELVPRVRDEHPSAEIWVGRGDPLRTASSFGILAQAFARGIGLGDTEDPATKRSKIAARVARHVKPESQRVVAEFLCELLGVGDASSDSPRIRAARQDPVVMGDQTRAAVIDWLDAECAAHPVLLVIDDLHWGDAATVRLLDGALSRLAERPLCVLSSARPEVHELFPGLWGSRDLQEIRVGPLTRRAAESLIRDMLPQVSDETVSEIAQRSGGNAFYLEELIRAHAEGRGSKLPDTVLGMVEERLEAMEPEARRVLRAASVFGHSFRPSDVSALLGGGTIADEVHAWLDTLEQREVLVRSTAGAARGESDYAFRQTLFRDAAYAMLTAEDRTLGHRLAAEHLAGQGFRDSVTLAEHFERGGEATQAVEWWHRAASDALDANDFDAALVRAARGFDLAPDDLELGRLWLVRAEASRLRGDPARALDAVERALASTPRGSLIWCTAMGERALVLQRLGQAAQLAESVEELATVDAPPEALDALALARTRTALAASRMGMRAKARGLFEGVERDRSMLGPLTAGYAHAFRAIEALMDGEPARYLAESASAIARHEAVGDVRAALEQRINIGSYYLELGAWERAEELLREAATTAERLGLPHALAGARHNLSLALAHLGRMERALELQIAARDAFQAVDRRLEGGAELALAMIHDLASNLPLAREHALRALDLLAMAAPPLVPAARSTLATIVLAQGDLEAATSLALEAFRALEASGGVEFGEPLIRRARAETLWRSGDRAAARAVADQGRARLLEQADEIADAELRASFLTRVPENARLLALAEELSEPATENP